MDALYRTYLPDTNVFSKYAKGADGALVARMDRHSSRLRLSAIVLAELKHGWEKAGDTRRTVRQRDFARKVSPVVPFDEECADAYAVVKLALSQPGNVRVIGPHDMLIAAQALARGFVLVTHNTREFSRIPGLELEDWQTLD
ncbi:MAG: PIN domain-containing protein [Opitutaceae bacterium]|jgi:tRNA(fMet)-specific endonuclease VapC|nr:PIN domain-containing protein [Opitutaceae bacterium]